MFLRHVIDGLASVLLPAPCRICQQPLLQASRVPVCTSCLSGFERIRAPFCLCCGRPSGALVTWQESGSAPDDTPPPLFATVQPCRLCRAGTYAFTLARSFAIYDDTLTSAIVLLKYEQVAPLGTWFAERLAETVRNCGQDLNADVVVPVPLHVDRLRERGYNQAEIIARPLARLLGLQFRSDVLVRTKPRPPQLVLSRRERWDSVRGAYATREGVRVDKARTLLVDDVFTTGATLDACARALRKAGAGEVKGLTVGRAVPDWSPLNP